MTVEEPQEYTILDHIDGVKVPGAVFREPANEYYALICLAEGMGFLHRQVKRCEEVVEQRMNPHGNLRVAGAGNLPAFSDLPMPLLVCSFHWYAISACQYVRLVGAIARSQDQTRPMPPAYVKNVIPEVLAFRDKVAAHFAWATKHERDNHAERLASVLPPLSFSDGRFIASGYRVMLRRSGKTTNSNAITGWSLTEVHERMIARYWPNPKT